MRLSIQGRLKSTTYPSRSTANCDPAPTLPMKSAIPTKLGLAPTDSPRTHKANKQRLGAFFSTLSLADSTAGPSSSAPYPNPPDSARTSGPRPGASYTSAHGGHGSSESSGSDARPFVSQVQVTPNRNSAKAGGWLSWLTPNKSSSDSADESLQEDEGCFDAEESAEEGDNLCLRDGEKDSEASEGGPQLCQLEKLPDEL